MLVRPQLLLLLLVLRCFSEDEYEMRSRYLSLLCWVGCHSYCYCIAAQQYPVSTQTTNTYICIHTHTSMHISTYTRGCAPSVNRQFRPEQLLLSLSSSSTLSSPPPSSKLSPYLKFLSFPCVTQRCLEIIFLFLYLFPFLAQALSYCVCFLASARMCECKCVCVACPVSTHAFGQRLCLTVEFCRLIFATLFYCFLLRAAFSSI